MKTTKTTNNNKLVYLVTWSDYENLEDTIDVYDTYEKAKDRFNTFVKEHLEDWKPDKYDNDDDYFYDYDHRICISILKETVK